MIETIKNTLSLILQDFINLVHVFDTSSSNNAKDKELSKTLKKEGIIEIPNYIEPALCDSLKATLFDLISESQTENVHVNYRNKDNLDGSDSGMIDIFHVDQHIDLEKKINIDYLANILQDTLKQEITFFRANAYINNSVQGTRCYHVDNIQPVIYKAFIYLTDVPSIKYGPYSFVKRSHRFSGYVYLNLLKNLFQKNNRSPDMTIVKKKNIKNCIAEKGTLILSSQNGIHRGLPQEKGKERVALIMNFMVRSKLSHIHATAKKNLESTKENKT